MGWVRNELLEIKCFLTLLGDLAEDLREEELLSIKIRKKNYMIYNLI